MKLEVQQKLVIEDGKHEGVIVDVKYRSSPYNYTDIIIEFMQNKKPIKLKAGYPTIVSKDSKLGSLLTRFGVNLNVGSQVDPDILIGKKCQFMTNEQPSKKDPSKKYAEVVPESVKP